MIKNVTLFVFMVCFFFSSAQAQRKIKMTDTVSTADKMLGLATLWKESAYNFVWFDKQPNLNWDSVYRAYIPKVLSASNVFEVNRVLTKFLEELKDGHTAVWVNQGFWDEIDQPPVSITRVDGKLLVYRLDSNLKDELPLKSEVLKINGREASEFLKNDSWLGFKGSEIKVLFKKPDGKEKIIVLKRNLNDLFKLGKFQYFPATNIQSSPKFAHHILKGNIGFVQINTFSDSAVVDSFKNILPTLKTQRALILDLRNNGGGNSDYALEIAKVITDKQYLVGSSWRTRINNAANKAWGSFNKAANKTPDYKYKEYQEMNAWEFHPGDTIAAAATESKLNRPVVILTSKNTFSAAEDFLIYLLGSKNIIRIGQPSAGSSGQPLRVELPIGMIARICAKRDMLPDGTDYIGIGIQPDILVPAKSIFSTDTKDEELQVALNYLKKSL
ncbi:S41 family peptidase [Pedobacter duraquae]|uniref:Tricorn protease-like protein n=1 Tax=Pedobacter duraquae TaxID=425511 RepID=A0A4R6ILV8_9SPHI|nr:S41 family peptidase [Pedobacter duraquae]TDO22956.1 tricorn protease-like protein [Pedobacter duraquae]